MVTDTSTPIRAGRPAIASPGAVDAKEPAVNPTIVTVKGMTCEHCVSAVQKEIGRLPGVTGVEVELDTGTVRVTADPPPGVTELRDAVDAAGYELTG
jgi:copper chaperone